MKTAYIVPALVLGVLVTFPTSSQALSCMDTTEMIPLYGSDAQYSIVTATPTRTTEHIKEAPRTDDPNAQFPSGFTAQKVTVEKVHKGSSQSARVVYFERNGTWDYLCVSKPPAVGTKSVYVLTQPASEFDVVRVAAVYPSDSKFGMDIIKAAEGNTEMPDPELYKTDAAYWVTQLRDQLKETAFMVKVKLAEWNMWRGEK
jgi:hypothetical protein